MVIGFSCGDFHRLQNNGMERFSEETMSLFQHAGARGVELMCHTTDHLAYLADGVLDHIKKFDHISVHAPAYVYDDDALSHKLLEQLEVVSRVFRAAYVVFHPDLVRRWDIVNRYDMHVAIENMDDRKETFRTADDVKALLEIYPFGLVIDLQHCFINDASMQLAHDLHAQLSDRLVGYHISGYDPTLLHVPLCGTGQDIIVQALERADVPIIIESSFAAYGDAQKELDYIKKHL